MNKIYKLIWSKTKNCWVVASELAKGHGKNKSRREGKSLLAVAVMTALLGGAFLPAGMVSAADGAAHYVNVAVNTGKTIEARKYPGEAIEESAVDPNVNYDLSANPTINAISIGAETSAGANGAVAMGFKTIAKGEYATALGTGSAAYSKGDLALGWKAYTDWNEPNKIAIGTESTALKENGISIGTKSKTWYDNAIAIGNEAETGNKGGVTSNDSIAIGNKAKIQGQKNVAIGSKVTVGTGSTSSGSSYVVAIGSDSHAYDTDSVVIGGHSEVHENAVVVGNRSKAGMQSVAVGSSIEAGEWSVAIGLESKAKDHAIAMGYSSEASAVDSVAFGNNASAKGLGAIAIGGNYDRPNEGAQAYSGDTIAIGRGSVAGNEEDTATVYNSVAVGREARAYGKNSIALGGTANVGDIWQKQLADGGTAIGSSANAALENATAIGYHSIAYAKDAVTIGANTRADIDGGVALGSDSNVGYNPLPSYGKAGKAGYDPLDAGTDETSTWKSTRAAVSVGNQQKGITRQIINVAAGTDNTDAVNVAQLKSLRQRAWKDLAAAKDELGGRIAGNTTSITALSTRVGTNERDIGRLKTDVNTNKQDIRYLYDNMPFMHYVSVKSEGSAPNEGNYDNRGATKLGAIAIGAHTTSDGDSAVALGAHSFARGQDSVVIGADSDNYTGGKPAKEGQFDKNIILGSNNTIFAQSAENGGREDKVIGNMNRVEESHGTFVRGTGNFVYDAYNPEALTDEDKQKEQDFLDPIDGGDPTGLFQKGRSHVSVEGDGNLVSGALYTQVSGVGNEISNTDNDDGTSTPKVTYNIVTGNRNTVADSSNNIIMGDNHELENVKGNIIIGSQTKKTKTEKSNVTILGNDANVSEEGGVALGTGSVASTAAGVFGYDPATGEASTTDNATWKSGNGAVSVGTDKKTRQITNLAAGAQDTDAVNVAQLKALEGKVTTNAGDITTLKEGWTLADAKTGKKVVKATNTVKVTGDDYIKATVNSDGLTLGMNETKLNTQINDQIDNSETVKAKMNSWVLKAATTDKDPAAKGQTIDNTNNVATFDATGKGLTVTRDGSTIKYGIDGSAIDIANNQSITNLGKRIDNLDPIHYFSVNSTATGAGSNYKNDGAKKDGSIAIGPSALNNGTQSVAVGLKSKVEDGWWSVALGTESKTNGHFTTAIGYQASATMQQALALGTQAEAAAESSISIGTKAKSLAYRGIAVGINSTVGATGRRGIAIGEGSYVGEARPNDTTAMPKPSDEWKPTNPYESVDDNTKPKANETAQEKAMAVGFKAGAFGYQTTALGAGAQAHDSNTTAVGVAAVAKGHHSTALGMQARTFEKESTSVGHWADSRAEFATALGSNTIVYKKGGVALGFGARAYDENSIAIGSNSFAKEAIDGKAYLSDEEVKAAAGIVSVGNPAYKVGDKDFAANYRRIVNVAGGINDNDAVNVAQLKALEGKVTTNKDDITTLKEGWTLEDAAGSKKVVKATNTVKVTGDKYIKATVSDAGLALSMDETELNTQINNQIDNSATVKAKMNSWVLKAATTDKDPAAKGQTIDNTNNVATFDATGEGLTVERKDSTITYSIDGSKINISQNETVTGLQKEIKDSKTTVEAGDYVTVTPTKKPGVDGTVYTVTGPKLTVVDGEENLVVGDITEGNKKVGYNLKLKKDLTGLTSVTSEAFKVGDKTYIDKDGINANDNKITNVADGDVSENSTDAVNGGQLYKLQQTVAGNKVTVEAAPDSQITVTAEPQNDKSTKYVVDIAKDGTIGGDKDGNLVTGKTVKDYVDANKVTVTGDDVSGVKVETIVEKGKPANYKVSLGNKIKAGDVTVDGTEGKGQITGLSNKTWDADKIVSGRAATEDQLKAVSENAAEAAKKHTTVVAGDYVTVSEGTNANGGKEYTVNGPKVEAAQGETNLVVGDIKEGDKKVGYNLSLNKELKGLTSVSSDTFKAGDKVTINNEGLTIKEGPSVTTKGIDAGDKVIANVKDGKADTDAVNVRQLNALANQSNQNIAILGGKVGELGNRVNRVGAGAAALAALHPLDFDPDDKWDFAAGYGNYKGANAAAIGAYYRPNEDTMVSVGGSFGGGENMVNAGVSVKLGQGNHVTTSRVAMAKEIKDLRAEVEVLRQAVTGIGQGQTPDPVKMKLFPDIAKNHWAYEAVEELTKQGLLEGYPDGTFGGDRMMTRYEFAEIVYRAMQKGLNVNEKLIQEFEPELERFRIDVISKDKDGNPVIERVRVNEKKKAK